MNGSFGQESLVFEERSCCEAPPFEGIYRGKSENLREPHLGVMLEDAVPHQAIEIGSGGAELEKYRCSQYQENLISH